MAYNSLKYLKPNVDTDIACKLLLVNELARFKFIKYNS